MIKPYRVVFKGFLIILAFALSVITSLAITNPIPATSTTSVRVEPALNVFGNAAGDPIPIPGTQFTVTVTVYNVQNFYGYDLKFRWNTTYLSYVSHTVLASWRLPVRNEVYPEGWYWIAYSKMLPDPPASGNVPIFSMTFQIIKQPYSYETGNPTAVDPIDTLLDFISTDLADPDGNPIPHTVEPATVRIWEKRPLPVVGVFPALIEFGNSDGDYIPPGTRFSVKVNITNAFNLYGFEIQFRWNTEYLSYVSHYLQVPRDFFPHGILWKPYQKLKDELNTEGGTYLVNCTSLSPAPSFNGSGVVFIMTFEVIKQPYYNETGTPLIEPVDVFLNVTSTKLIDKTGALVEHRVESATVRIWEKRWLPIVRVEPTRVEYRENAVGQNLTVRVRIIGVENLYGIDIAFVWDTRYLEYLNHTVTIPVEEYPDGILHGSVFFIADQVNKTLGTYRLVCASMAPAPSFNGSGTVFIMTFRIKFHPLEPEPTVRTWLRLNSTDLADKPDDLFSEPIEHVVEHGLVILWQRPFEPKPVLKVKPLKTVIQGGVFQINITIEDLDAWWELVGFDIKLAFNKSSLQALNILEGPFLKQFGDTFLLVNQTNNDEGFVQIAVSLLTFTSIPEGNGVLATVTFQTTSEATFSLLHLYETELAANANETKWGVIWSMPIPHTTLDGTFVLDTTPPTLSSPYQNPPGLVMTPGVIVEVDVGLNVTVRVNVTDAHGVDKVILHYNVSATQWAQIEMNPLGEGQYVAVIPSSHLPICTTVAYYITATDIAGNTAQTPINGVHFGYHVIPEFPSLTFLMLTMGLMSLTLIWLAKPSKIRTKPRSLTFQN